MERAKKSKHGCLWALVVLQSIALIVMFIIIVVMSLASASFSRPLKLHKAGQDERPEMNEIWSCGSGDIKVVRIPLSGLIMLDNRGTSFYGESSAANVLKSIHRATHDPEVKAIILEIDSGGGGITASDIIFKALNDFKKSREGRKVVAIFGDIAASGAYYIALAADCIIAHPTTVTGSIGVLMQSYNVRGLAERVGVKDVTFKSGPNKDLLNPFGDVTLEQSAMLQGIIDNMHNRFKKLVAEGRKISLEDVQGLADGRIFTADTALGLGLIDNIGYWQDAVEKTAQLLQVGNIKIYRYEEEFSFSDFLRSAQSWSPVTEFRNKLSGARLLYLWEM